MKNRILAAIAIAVALPAAAQANSAVTERHFEQQSEALNTQQTSEYHALSTSNRIETTRGGHSDAADEALHFVSESTQQGTHIAAGNSERVSHGHSVAAAQALQNAEQAGSTTTAM